MFIVRKGTTDKYYFYLTGSQSYALFNIKSNDTGRLTLIGATNTSTTAAYDEFTFTEGGGLSASGEFTLDPGTYNIEVWTGNSNQLNISTASVLLHRDLMKVIGTGSTFIWQNPTASNDFVYYNPEAYPPTGMTGQ